MINADEPPPSLEATRAILGVQPGERLRLRSVPTSAFDPESVISGVDLDDLAGAFLVFLAPNSALGV